MSFQTSSYGMPDKMHAAHFTCLRSYWCALNKRYKHVSKGTRRCRPRGLLCPGNRRRLGEGSRMCDGRGFLMIIFPPRRNIVSHVIATKIVRPVLMFEAFHSNIYNSSHLYPRLVPVAMLESSKMGCPRVGSRERSMDRWLASWWGYRFVLLELHRRRRAQTHQLKHQILLEQYQWRKRSLS